jgi:hypothetical protein
VARFTKLVSSAPCAAISTRAVAEVRVDIFD